MLAEGGLEIASERRHWLLEEARHAGLVDESVELPSSVSDVEAWERASLAAGVTEEELAAVVAGRYHLPTADLDHVDPAALKLLPEALARRWEVLPLRLDHQHLILATADPLNVEAELQLGFLCGRHVTFAVAPPSALMMAIEEHYAPERVLDVLLRGLEHGEEAHVRVLRPSEPEAVAEADLVTPPVVRLSSAILREAVHLRATDIHVEPERSGGRVRFRIDGVLQPFMTLPMSALVRLVSRIKILADLDIADHLRPQDGRIRVEVEGRAYDLRISTMPTRKAEKCVIRILDPDASFSLESLALSEPEADRIRTLLEHRDGIVIMTGPTGCGKTTTLYAAIQGLNDGELNISTVENPVEYELPGITQVQVETKQGLTFAGTLRALLRQDPDVILVGEIRDAETAETAARAAMTGHLVLSTLHTTDAATAIPRLHNLGLESEILSATLRGVVAQRLVRRLCDACSTPTRSLDELSGHERELADMVGLVPARRAVGCSRCRHTGYFGRIPVSEVLVVDMEVARMLARGAAAWELEEEAVRRGMRTMQQVGLDRVARGETTLTELQRVLGADLAGDAAPVAEPAVIVAGTEVPGGVETLKALLPGRHLPLRTFNSVDEAEAGVTRESAPALVLVGPDLPGGGAEELIRRVRRSVACATVPVVVVEDTYDHGRERGFIELGADDYLGGTTDLDCARARLRNALRRQGFTAPEPEDVCSVNP